MANLTEVQLPNGTTYKLVDDESGYITEAEVEGMIGDKADKTLVSYCSCSTAAATAQKEVVAPEGWVLESGRIIAVKFVNTNTAQNPTLKVGTADAKSIYYNNAVVTTGSLFAGGEADRVTLYIYDGTRFVWLGHSIDTNTTYSAMTASELTTGTATTLRTVRADYLKTGINNLISGKADKTDIATVESGTTASRAYSVGELVYVSGTLYRVKTAIASGATFTVGTNVEVTNVSNFLNQFSSVDIRSFSGRDITRLRGSITQIGNVCILIGIWEGSATNITKILTLPTQYRPSSTLSSGGEGGITINGVYGKSEYTLNTDGTVRQAESVAAGTSGTFTFVYTL